MRCEACRRQVGLMTLTCRECQKQFCTRCIHLDIHQCLNIEQRKQSELASLKEKLVQVQSQKIQKI